MPDTGPFADATPSSTPSPAASTTAPRPTPSPVASTAAPRPTPSPAASTAAPRAPYTAPRGFMGYLNAGANAGVGRDATDDPLGRKASASSSTARSDVL